MKGKKKRNRKQMILVERFNDGYWSGQAGLYHRRDDGFQVPGNPSRETLSTIDSSSSITANDLYTSDKTKRKRAPFNPIFMKRIGAEPVFSYRLRNHDTSARNAYCLPDVDRNEINLRLLPPTYSNKTRLRDIHTYRVRILGNERVAH